MYFVGTPADGEPERLKAAGYGVVSSPIESDSLGDLIAWICANAYGIYMCAGWRSSNCARAIRATAIAVGLVVFGFE